MILKSYYLHFIFDILFNKICFGSFIIANNSYFYFIVNDLSITISK